MLDFDTCPNCGQKILKGAMRCVGCGKILKTPEEQLASIQKLKESKKRFDIARLLKIIVLLLAIGIIYYYFSAQIIEFINGILRK
jgi:uncharacterized membrane protein YvbJ